MRKYAELCPADARPELIFALPELAYPDRLNAVRTVLEGAREAGWSARPAFYFQGVTITHGDVAAQVARHAAAFAALGIAAGDRVLVRIADTPDLVYAILALQAIGAVAMPTYVQLRADDLVYRVDDAGASSMIVDAALIDEAAKTVEARPDLAPLIVLPSDPTGRFVSLGDHLPATPPHLSYADTDADDLALILYTSGSTGAPKGAVHCHRDMLAICDTYWRGCIAPDPDDVLAGPPSIAFALGFGMFVYFPLRLGHAAVLEPDKSPEATLAAIRRHRVTILAAVVSYVNVLARRIEETGADVSSLKRTMTGGEPLTRETELMWRAATGRPLEQFIGTTETLHCFVTSTRPDGPPRSDTLGLAVPGYEVRTIDPSTGKPLPPGEQGLLAVRGPTGTVYLDKPEQQRASVVDGWCVFQDLVWQDEEGYFHYVARHDDMIVSAGYNISPVEVEAVLMRHDAVIECACVPAADPTGRRGQVVKAFVVARDGAAADGLLTGKLQDFVKANAAPYKYPRVIEFVPDLPKTINGKILRTALRARANQ